MRLLLFIYFFFSKFFTKDTRHAKFCWLANLYAMDVRGRKCK
jgi:hypothetical protein